MYISNPASQVESGLNNGQIYVPNIFIKTEAMESQLNIPWISYSKKIHQAKALEADSTAYGCFIPNILLQRKNTCKIIVKAAR